MIFVSAPAIEIVLSLILPAHRLKSMTLLLRKLYGMAQSIWWKEGKLKNCTDKYEVLENASGVVVMTEWREFKVPDLSFSANMKERVILMLVTYMFLKKLKRKVSPITLLDDNGRKVALLQLNSKLDYQENLFSIKLISRHVPLESNIFFT